MITKAWGNIDYFKMARYHITSHLSLLCIYCEKRNNVPLVHKTCAYLIEPMHFWKTGGSIQMAQDELNYWVQARERKLIGLSLVLLEWHHILLHHKVMFSSVFHKSLFQLKFENHCSVYMKKLLSPCSVKCSTGLRTTARLQ